MSGKSGKSGSGEASAGGGRVAERARRQAEQLRANLLKRKQQSRARQAPEPASAADDTESPEN